MMAVPQKLRLTLRSGLRAVRCTATKEAPVHPTARKILDYWFEGKTTAQTFVPKVAGKWFGGGPAVDEEIQTLFGEDVRRFKQGEFRDWKESPKNNIAAILLADQFTRCVYRGKAEQFGLDPVGLEFAQYLLDTEMMKTLDDAEKIFAFLPFEHSEELQHQKLACRLFSELHDEVKQKHGEDNAFVSFIKGCHDYAIRHRIVIERFGRFPHRNDCLGRDHSVEEIEAKRDGTLDSFG